MRPDLMALLGERVTVTNPHVGSSWTGKLAAVGNEPCVVIDQDHGPRLCLPQSFTVTPADDTPPTPKSSARRELDPDSDHVIHAYRHPWLNADDTPSAPQWATIERDGHVTYTWPNVPPTADLVTGARVHGWPDMRAVAGDLAALRDMTTNLGQHIDERAAELAQPHIDQARAEVAEAQEERDQWRTRFTDLQGEHQRQHKVVERRAVRAETAIARALGTMRANTLPPPAHPTDYQRGYQACADHVTTALHDSTDQQETDRG